MTDTTDTPENYTPAVVVEPTVTVEIVPEYDQADGSFH